MTKRTANQWVQFELDFDEAQKRFRGTGECYHDPKFQEVTLPYKCDVKLITCSVCNETLEKVYLGTMKVDNISNILLHSKTSMTVGIQLSKTQFKAVSKELPLRTRKQLLKIYRKYARVLGNVKSGARPQEKR